MIKDLHIELGGLVVKPDEVLIVVLPEKAPPGFGNDVRDALNGIGLSGRSLVIRGDAKLATVPKA